MSTTTFNQPWNNLEKTSFRFMFIFLTLFIILNNNGLMWLSSLIFYFPVNWLQKFIGLIGTEMLDIPSYLMNTKGNGSGDTSFHYVQLLFTFIVAVIGSGIWSVLDWNRIHYAKLLYWLSVAVRFYLGFMLINYGLVKVIKLQFPDLSLSRSVQTYGDSSPMGLAWTFLGFSKGYNIFMGIAELMGALLFVRRTVSIGAIISLMTCLNIMAVNYFYDIPVKILSTMLVIMCLFLLAPNMLRLIRFFFMGLQSELRVQDAPVFKKEWMRNAKPLFKWAMILVPICFTVYLLPVQAKKRNIGKNIPMRGVYQVREFKVDAMPVSDTSSIKKWDKLVIEYETRSSIKYDHGYSEWIKVKVDTSAKKIDITFEEEGSASVPFTYRHTNEGIIFEGKVEGREIYLLTKKLNFELDRGFRWINEMPYNR